MDPCSQAYANAPCPPPPLGGHLLPFTGAGFELVLLVGFAAVAITLGLLARWSDPA